MRCTLVAALVEIFATSVGVCHKRVHDQPLRSRVSSARVGEGKDGNGAR